MERCADARRDAFEFGTSTVLKFSRIFECTPISNEHLLVYQCSTDCCQKSSPLLLHASLSLYVVATAAQRQQKSIFFFRQRRSHPRRSNTKSERPETADPFLSFTLFASFHQNAKLCRCVLSVTRDFIRVAIRLQETN